MSADYQNSAKIRVDLLALWRSTIGGKPPSGLSTRRVERAIRYFEQVTNDPAMARLDRQVNRRLKQLEHQPRPRGARLLPGTRMLREWGGTTHEVTVTDQGYLYRGTPWRSLSAIAEAITGTRWSGPKFFGVI